MTSFFDTSWALTQGFFDLKVKASKLDDEPQADHKKEANKPLFFDTSWALTQADSSFLECYRHHHLKSDIAPHIIDTTTTRYGV